MMTWQLKVLVAPPEGWGSVPSTHSRWLTTIASPVPGTSMAFLVSGNIL